MPNAEKSKLKDGFKLGILCYVAPPSLVKSKSFFENLRNFPAKHELIVYSDHNYSAEWMGCYKLNGNVEIAKTTANRMAVQNLIFFTGIRIAASRGFTHVLILEHDCRVGVDGWDDVIWQEFISKNRGGLMGGSMFVMNPCSFNRKAAEKFEEFSAKDRKKRLVPISVYGSNNASERRDSCVFPNGAFAIYRMDWLLKTFPEITGSPQQYISLAQTVRTWDQEIGMRLWSQFNEDSYDKVVSLESIYSGYGDVLSSEEERKQWLQKGRVAGIHQIKSHWSGPVPGGKPSSKISITAITCTGDRPEAFALCEKWMERQTSKPDNWIVLDDGKIPTQCNMGQQYVSCPEFYGQGSLINKLRLICSQNMVKTDALVFIEDDDWYHPEWIEFCLKNLADYDLVGEGRALYYNVRERWHYEHKNMEHASLCATAMRTSLLPVLFSKCDNSNPFVDVRLWRSVHNRKKVFDPFENPDQKRMTVGTKGFPGRTGYGAGHVVRDVHARDDADLEKLKTLVGDDIELYRPFNR